VPPVSVWRGLKSIRPTKNMPYVLAEVKGAAAKLGLESDDTGKA